MTAVLSGIDYIKSSYLRDYYALKGCYRLCTFQSYSRRIMTSSTSGYRRLSTINTKVRIFTPSDIVQLVAMLVRGVDGLLTGQAALFGNFEVPETFVLVYILT